MSQPSSSGLEHSLQMVLDGGGKRRESGKESSLTYEEAEIVLLTIDLQMIYPVGKGGVPALRGVDLTVRGGEFLAIMGPSGCGKSTLLHILGGLLTPTGGQVLIDGRDLTRMADGERTALRKKKVGFVFQRFNLFPTLTAEANLELAERICNGYGTDSARRREVLQAVGLEKKKNRKPGELSGGEQQRVALARAIINRPFFLLADEPTGNLDSGSSNLILEMLKELNGRRGQTIVMITHNPCAAEFANRTVHMKDGEIVG